MYRHLRRFALGLLTLLTLAACGVAAQSTAQTIATPVASPAPDSTAEPKIGAHDTLLTIRAEGGMCANGGCWSENQIKADGSFTAADYTGTQTTGTLDAAQVAELTQQIAATDFEQVKAQPFTGTCPLAFDRRTLTIRPRDHELALQATRARQATKEVKEEYIPVQHFLAFRHTACKGWSTAAIAVSATDTAFR